ncbi:hypothetical protein Zmor_020306 [Zophobas morio]|uniref:Uncharacterized protein n=1 Tax=Zophobas morio TaxID=2755281 RepID=A0AA38I145_9CUCU|nr:hypothetical protein Zmor_020306 [Zophobas morio]
MLSNAATGNVAIITQYLRHRGQCFYRLLLTFLSCFYCCCFEDYRCYIRENYAVNNGFRQGSHPSGMDPGAAFIRPSLR